MVDKVYENSFDFTFGLNKLNKNILNVLFNNYDKVFGAIGICYGLRAVEAR